MSSKEKNLSEVNLSKQVAVEGFNIHIVVSEWNTEITSELLKGALDTLIKAGIPEDTIEVLQVPGTFELPVAAKTLLQSKSADAIICLGCVIKGDTDHDVFINQSVAIALNQLAIMNGKPMIFGVLTVNDRQQALDRSGGKHGNKGVEAAATAIKMVSLQKGINTSSSKIGFS